MTTNEYKPTRIKVREDHLTALEAKVDAMGGTVILDFFVNDALAQYLAPAVIDIDKAPRFGEGR